MKSYLGLLGLFNIIIFIIAFAYKNPYLLVGTIVVSIICGIGEEKTREEVDKIEEMTNKIKEKDKTYSNSISDSTVKKIFLLGDDEIRNSILFDLYASNSKSYLISLENFLRDLPYTTNSKEKLVKRLKKYCRKNKNREKANIILNAIVLRENEIREEFERRTRRFY